MALRIFGTKKCKDTKKAERFFKERGVKYRLMRTPIVRDGKRATVDYAPEACSAWLTG